MLDRACASSTRPHSCPTLLNYANSSQFIPVRLRTRPSGAVYAAWLRGHLWCRAVLLPVPTGVLCASHPPVVLTRTTAAS
jgi:hypothetical protein